MSFFLFFFISMLGHPANIPMYFSFTFIKIRKQIYMQINEVKAEIKVLINNVIHVTIWIIIPFKHKMSF